MCRGSISKLGMAFCVAACMAAWPSVASADKTVTSATFGVDDAGNQNTALCSTFTIEVTVTSDSGGFPPNNWRATRIEIRDAVAGGPWRTLDCLDHEPDHTPAVGQSEVYVVRAPAVPNTPRQFNVRVIAVAEDACDGSGTHDSPPVPVTTVAGTPDVLTVQGPDRDNDGCGDACDGCPDDGNKCESGICGCGIADTDSDTDGSPDCVDECPDNPDRCKVGACGCDYFGPVNESCPCPGGREIDGSDGNGCTNFEYDIDQDGDGVFDCHDQCPKDPLKSVPGFCGCNWPDDDTDGDGTPDCPCPGESEGTWIEGKCGDQCPTDPEKIEPGICGCQVSDADKDGDGTPDCLDQCPNDPDKTAPGQCDCGTPDTDQDNDDTADCNDLCPKDPLKVDPGNCGCGNQEEVFTVGGIVYGTFNQQFTTGQTDVKVELSCLGGHHQAVTTCPDENGNAAGLWSFPKVPCDLCWISFSYLRPECNDTFTHTPNGVAIGPVPSAGIKIIVGPEFVVQNANIQVLAHNGLFDLNEDGIVTIAGDLPPWLSCIFFGNCVCQSPPDCLCRLDCGGAQDGGPDGLRTIVGDLPCFVDCLFFGDCNSSCEDRGASGGRSSGFDYTVGGAYTDPSDPFGTGVQGSDVLVFNGSGDLVASTITGDFAGYWTVSLSQPGTYRVVIDKISRVIQVNSANTEANGNLVLQPKSPRRGF